MGTTSAAPSFWIKAAPCLHQKLIHPHHFCPFKLLSLLPALNYLMPSSSILLHQNCVIFIRWISSIRRPKAIPFLSHITFFLYKKSTVSSWKSSLFNQSSNNDRIVQCLVSKLCTYFFKLKTRQPAQIKISYKASRYELVRQRQSRGCACCSEPWRKNR